MKALFYLTFLGIFFISCTKERLEANGNIRTEVRNPGTFSSVSSSGSKRIHISYGHVYEIELRGSSNLIPRYKTRIHNNTLSVGYENVNVVDDDLEVYITMPQFEGARLSGSGKIYVSGLFPYREHCDFDISGSGDITVRDEFEVEDLDINISGSGNVNADKILSSNADVNISGSGDARVNTSDHLRVRISGSGKVYYSGNPVIDSKISGSGKVIEY